MQGGNRNCPGFPCKQIIVSQLFATGGPPGEALVAKGEMYKAGQATGSPGVYFMFFMVKLY